MAISRTNLATYLDTQFSKLAKSIGQNATPLTGYAPDIDNALRRMGRAEGELAAGTVEDADRELYFAWAEYFAARRFWRQLSNQPDTRVGGTGDSTISYGNVLKNAKSLVDDAKEQLKALGVDIDGDEAKSAWSAGWLNMDWVEPEAVE